MSLKGKRQGLWAALPRFIWGVDSGQRSFLLHTQFPRFLCEVHQVGADGEEPAAVAELSGDFLDHPEGGRCWESDLFWARGWVFFEQVTAEPALGPIMEQALQELFTMQFQERTVGDRQAAAH